MQTCTLPARPRPSAKACRSLNLGVAAALAATALALCSTVGVGANVIRATGHAPSHVTQPGGPPHVTVLANGVPMQRDAKCPIKFNQGCYTVSASTGLVIDWCVSSGSASCNLTSQYSFNSTVCLAKSFACGRPTGKMTGAFSGPFQCSPSIGLCEGGTSGSYEVDTITPRPGLRQTRKYLYEQDARICPISNPGNCSDAFLGFNVGP
jgi:hypothetical protein